jgi:hypothetical protein
VGGPRSRSSAEEAVAGRYRRFAREEARGRSPLYEELAEGVARHRETLRFLAALPTDKRQPNLLFAAARHVCGTPSEWAGFRRALAGRCEEIAAVMLSRRTQTNEPARCAMLLPALAALRQPLALLEVGAAAGLCLLPDYYGYDFAGHVIPPAVHTLREAPVFRCEVEGPVAVPSGNVRVVWRRGLDIAPVDLRDRDAVSWLETLVWPGEEYRLVQLRMAIDVAREVAPVVEQGDAASALPALIRDAPPDATLVVFHSALMPYLSAAGREAFVRIARRQAFWLANEGPGLQPRAAFRTRRDRRAGDFLLSLNETPLAWTDPHGARIAAIRPTPPGRSALG